MSSTALKSSASPLHRVFTLVPAARPNSSCAMARMDPGSTTSLDGERGAAKGVLHQLKRLLSGSDEAMAETCPRSSGVESLALLFQTILQEDRLTPLLRVWIARLQTPVMQQALADPDSFQDQKHPARRLLASFGASAMGFGGGVLPCGALEQEIKRLVLLIEQYPDVGTRVYEQANEEFTKFLTRFETDPAQMQEVDCVMCQKDQKDALSIQYMIALRDLLKDKPVQAEIREFLFKIWTEVLAVTAVRQGLQHADTLVLKKTAVDLIGATGALIEPTGHSYAIRKIPQLLQRLRAGMSLVSLPADQQDAHVKMISGTLAKAFLSRQLEIAPDVTSAIGKLPGPNDQAVRQTDADAEALSGLEIIEDDPATTWRLWDCALVEQDLKDRPLPVKNVSVVTAGKPQARSKSLPVRWTDPLATIELHHRRVAGAIRSLWSDKECGAYINKLIVEGGDGMGHDRMGFNQSAVEAMMALASLHQQKFGSLKQRGATVQA